MKVNEQIGALHAAYCEATGLDLVLTTQRMFAWEAWLEHGARAKPAWGVDQIVNTIAFLHREIKNGDRRPACLRFVYLVENPANFEEELTLARRDWIRGQRLNRKPKFAPDKASVLRATGRPDAPTESDAKPAAAALPNWKGLADAMRQEVSGTPTPTPTPETPHAIKDTRLES